MVNKDIQAGSRRRGDPVRLQRPSPHPLVRQRPAGARNCEEGKKNEKAIFSRLEVQTKEDSDAGTSQVTMSSSTTRIACATVWTEAWKSPQAFKGFFYSFFRTWADSPWAA